MTRALQVLAMTVLLCVSALAQTSGTIAGNVLDPSGAAVPGATVTATNTGTGYVRTVASNESGAYLLTLMPVGTYTVSAEASGFKPVRQLDVVLSVNQNVRVDLSLELGETSEFIEVSAAVTEVDTRQASITHLMDQKRMIDLPLNGRNPASLIALLPGVTSLSVPDRPSIGGVNLRMNGTNAMMQQFLLDGSPFNAVQRSDGLPLPPPDIVQEFRVQANSFSAEYGRNAGGIISTITKSGTNDFHGSLWEYFRNNKLNARNFFDPGVPTLRQNQFGFSVGGPIVRNKTFFLGSYQGMRIREVRLANTAIPPTAAEKTGDFSAASRRPNDPLTGAPFPNGIIPSDRFDPAAVKVLGLLPAANTTDGRYEELASQPTDSNQYMLRIDQQIGSKNTLSGKYWRDHGDILDPWPFGTNLPYSPGVFDLLIYNFSVNDTHTFSPTVINEARFAYTQRDENRFNTLERDVRDFGILIAPPQDPFSPDFDVTGRFVLGTQINGQPTKKDDTISFSDTVSLLKGSHTIKTGFSMESPLMQGIPQFDNGDFLFNGQITGNPLADLLIGRPVSFNQNIGRKDNHRATYWGFFIQDDYKVSSRMTLNLGLRYQYNQRLKHRDNWGSNLYLGPNLSLDAQSQRFPEAPPGLLFDGDPGVDPSFYNADKNDWAPRIGIAYDLTGNGKTSIRAGWGVFYQLTLVEIANFLAANPPFVARAAISDPFSLTNPWGDRYQGGVDDPISTFRPGETPVFTFPTSLRAMEPGVRNGYIQQYSLSFQHQLAADTIFEAAYVGNSARKLTISRELNYAVPGPGATTGNTNARRILLPGTYAGITWYDDSGTSNHNGAQFSVRQRYSNSFTYSVAYTWSKTIDISSGETGGGVAVANPFNLNAERGVSSFDRAHVLTTSLVWDMPYLRTASNPFLRHAIGGWSIAGLWRAASGPPINITSGGDFALMGIGNQRPNVVGDPVLSGDRSRDEKLAAWFDKGAFARNGVGDLGNLGRNALRGPGEWNVDLNLMKNFRVMESQTLQFRAEFFNLFNHANLNNPTTNQSSGNFGRILSASRPRAIQLALRYSF